MRETNPVFVPVRRDRMTSRIRRALIRAVVALTGSYVLLLRFPEPVFAHSEFHRGVETRHRIFITESPALYALFNGPYRRAMARNVEIGHAIFVPRLDVVIASWRLPWWKREGYPEYIGSRGGTELDSPPAYRNAALRWKELLDRGVPFDTVIARRNP